MTFKVSAGSATGEVSISLFERSSYPRTGGLAYADGTPELGAAVEAIGPALSDSAALDTMLRALAGELPAPPAQLAGQVANLPSASTGASSSSTGAAAGSSSSAPLNEPNDDDDDDDDDDAESNNDDDDDDDEQTNLDYDFARGAELENALLRLRHQWEVKDQKRRDAADAKRAAEEKEAEAALAALPASQKPRGKRAADGKLKVPQKQGAHQIFSSAEATRMLCNELFDMMKEEKEGFDGVSADCVECDIHTWRVKVSDVSPDCPLHADLTALKDAGVGDASIEFELTFTPDMHPFYPCFLKVVRPRFEGVVAEAVMTHPAMTLQGWDPMKRVKWLIRCAQALLERHGRVDASDARNDPAQHPLGAYTAAEWAICRLELLAQVTPIWAETERELIASRSAAVDLERIRELNYGKKPKPADKGSAKGAPWESGVGYGHTGTEGGAQWDITATEKAQAQVDVEMREMIERVTDCTRRGELRVDQVRQSCLRPLLWRQLRTASLLDVGSRPERTLMYTQMLNLVRAIAAWPALRPALAEPTGPPSAPGQPAPSVLTALEGVRKQAGLIEKLGPKSEASTDTELVATRQLAATILETCTEVSESCVAPPPEPPAVSPPKPSQAPAESAPAAAGRGARGAAAAPTPRTTRQQVAQAASGAPPAAEAAKPSGRRGKKEAAAAAPVPVSDADGAGSSSGSGEASASGVEAAYESTMRELSFDTSDSLPGHHYASRAEGKEAASTQLAARTKRLTLEAADMMGGALPVSVSSSIWARMCEGQMCLWRAMISGPEGTPYSAGLFIFDILCPSDYPNVAPKVNLQTTGGGTVRFNPNLYNCGKVCLSLLGTWQGDQGESWHPKTSTLLQVLMSIQALILVPDPFFNEPGYERNRGTPEGNAQSRSYNETIREATVRYAMIGQINKPATDLEEPIRTHFRLRRAAVLEQVKGWATDKGNSSRHATAMAGLVTELEAAMAKHL